MFPISWRIFARPLRDLLDKPRKRNRCESLKKLIMDKICDFVNELSAFWEFASSRIVEIGCQIPNNVSLVSFALIKSIPLYVQFLIRTLNAVATVRGTNDLSVLLISSSIASWPWCWSESLEREVTILSWTNLSISGLNHSLGSSSAISINW